MIDPLTLAALKRLASLEDPRDLVRISNVRMSNFDAVTIIEALETVSALQGLLSHNKLTGAAIRALFDE